MQRAVAVPELCVYALASRQAGGIHLRGVAGEPLEAVRIGRLDAIVGRVRAIPKPTERNLRRYDRTISALWRSRPALLPARFGTAVRDLADLDAMVRVRERALRRNIRAVRNRTQMTVRILQGPGIGDREAADQGVASRLPAPDLQSPTRGSMYLRSRQREQAIPAFEPLRASVTRWVREERVEKHRGVASIYHLVPCGSVDRYRSALERAAHEAGVRLIVSGPFPPYAFADTW